MSAPPSAATAAAPPQDNPAYELFLKGLKDGHLRLQRCRSCGTAFAPGRLCCEECWSDDLAWEDASGNGTLYSYVVFHRQFHSGHPVPYHVAVIELAEGPRLPCRIEVEESALKIGMPLHIQVTQGKVKVTP